MSAVSEQLACTLYGNDGRTYRFGPDEANPEDVVQDVSFGTEVPGWGFAEGSVKLNRPANLGTLDDNLFAKAHIYDRSGETVYDGRVAKLNRGGVTELDLELEGPCAHMDDDQTARVIYRDTDLGNWVGVPTSRKLLLYAFGIDTQSEPSTEFDDTGSPSLVLEGDGAWTAAKRCEALYDGGFAAALGSVYFAWSYQNLSATWTGQMDGYTDAAGTQGAVAGVDFLTGATSGVQTVTSVAARRYAIMQLAVPGGANAVQGDRRLWLKNLAVYGNHGLTKRGVEPAAGFYSSDVVAHALGKWAPLLDIAPDGIEQSTFIIPQLAFREFGATAREIVEAVSLFGASGFQPPDWGCYEDGFFWKTPGTYGRTWRLRRDQGAAPIDEGPTTETRCNGFVVTYTDASGDPRTVGPPGSGADYETDQLADTSPTNPVNAAGIPRRYGSRDVGITSQEGAVLLGTLLLKDANTRRCSGSVDLAGPVFDAAGNEYPPYMVRGGDYAVFEDDEDKAPKKIVSTNYSGGSTSASLDNKSTSIDTLLSQLDVAIKPAGF